MGFEEWYIILFFYNKVGCEIRLILLRGWKVGYVVVKNGYFKVFMIFFKSGVFFEFVIFEVKDLEIMNELEIDGDVKMVLIVFGEFLDEVINMIIIVLGKLNFVCLFIYLVSLWFDDDCVGVRDVLFKCFSILWFY